MSEDAIDMQQVAGLDLGEQPVPCAIHDVLVVQDHIASSTTSSVGETINWKRAVPGVSPGVGTVSRKPSTVRGLVSISSPPPGH